MYGPDDEQTFADDGNTLSRDLSCVGCGYNLRGLNRNRACPECGKAIRDTLKRIGPEDVPDLADELSALSWTYLGMSVLLLLCAVPVGMNVGWTGMIVVTALAGYRLVTLWRIDRVLSLRRNPNAIAVHWLFALSTAELGAGVVLLGILSISTPAAGAAGVLAGITIVAGIAGTIWIIALLAGLAAAGRVTQMLRQYLGIDGSTTLLNAQFALAVIAPWMLIVGVSIEVTGVTSNTMAASGALSFILASLCILGSSVLLFLALQHLSQNLHQVLIDERAAQANTNRIALAGRGVIEVDEAGRVISRPQVAPRSGQEDDLPPIPLVGEGEVDGRAGEASHGQSADHNHGADSDDDPMAHIEHRR